MAGRDDVIDLATTSDDDDIGEVPPTPDVHPVCCLCGSDLIYSTGAAAPLAAVTPCGHVACYGCLRDWLRQRRTCPFCSVATTGMLPLVL